MELDSLQLPNQLPSSSCIQELNGNDQDNRNSALEVHRSLTQCQAGGARGSHGSGKGFQSWEVWVTNVRTGKKRNWSSQNLQIPSLTSFKEPYYSLLKKSSNSCGQGGKKSQTHLLNVFMSTSCSTVATGIYQWASWSLRSYTELSSVQTTNANNHVSFNFVSPVSSMVPDTCLVMLIKLNRMCS